MVKLEDVDLLMDFLVIRYTRAHWPRNTYFGRDRLQDSGATVMTILRRNAEQLLVQFVIRAA